MSHILAPILYANFTGSALVVWYFLCFRLWGDKLSKHFYYLMLRMILLFFLIPVYPLGELYKWLLREIPVFRKIERLARLGNRILIDQTNYILVRNGNKWELNQGAKAATYLLIDYFLLVILQMFFWRLADLKNQEKICAAGEYLPEALVIPLRELRVKYHIKRQIRIIKCQRYHQIAAIGCVFPRIFFTMPETKNAWKLVLEHEIYHIKRVDVLWKFLARVIKVLFFWNPFVHYAAGELSILCEESCDEKILRGKSLEERKEYAAFLMEIYSDTEEKTSDEAAFAEKTTSSKKSHYRTIKRRIVSVLELEKAEMKRKKISVVCAMALFFLFSLSAMAYEDVIVIDFSNTDIRRFDETKETQCIIFLPGEADHKENAFAEDVFAEEIFAEEIFAEEIFAEETFAEETFAEEIFAEDVFAVQTDDEMYLQKQDWETTVYCIKADGTIIGIPNPDCATEAGENYLFCPFHVYEEVEVLYHTKYSYGGCRCDWYHAKRCEKCGKITDQTWIKTVIYPNCTHSE